MKIKNVTSYLESIFPLKVQESYDNSGLLIGDCNSEVTGILICLSITEAVIKEAISLNCNLIISHHPLIFNSIKKLENDNSNHKLVISCIKNDISVYALHTNSDKMFPGLNSYLAEKLGLKNISVLQPTKGFLKKLIVFCPSSHCEAVRDAIFKAGAGVIGAYDCCSFNIDGIGTFKANELSNPFVGKKNELHFEKEQRIETIFPAYLQNEIVKSMINAHPYEEVAYYIYNLENEYQKVGYGAVGFLEEAVSKEDFFQLIKQVFNLKYIKYSGDNSDKIKKIAICGGSGASLISSAIALNAHAYVSSDFKYHDFELGNNDFLLIDAGHYETEFLFKEFLLNILLKKFNNFAIHFSKNEKNQVSYY